MPYKPKTNAARETWEGILKWILIAGLLAGLGLCYMIMKNQNLHLAQEVEVRKLQAVAIDEQTRDLQDDLDHKN